MGKCFGSLLNVHNYYKYPGSYRHGTIYNENGVIRSYSNGTSGDYKENGYFYYNLKSDSIKSAFKINQKLQKTIRLFTKDSCGIVDNGLWQVIGFTKTHVCLKKAQQLIYMVINFF